MDTKAEITHDVAFLPCVRASKLTVLSRPYQLNERANGWSFIIFKQATQGFSWCFRSVECTLLIDFFLLSSPRKPM